MIEGTTNDQTLKLPSVFNALTINAASYIYIRIGTVNAWQKIIGITLRSIHKNK